MDSTQISARVNGAINDSSCSYSHVTVLLDITVLETHLIPLFL